MQPLRVTGSSSWPLHGILLQAVTACLLLSAFAVAHAAPAKLLAAVLVKGQIGLKWSKVEGVDTYVVYRKAAEGDFVKVAAVSEDRWFDTDLTPGVTYRYRIGTTAPGAKEEFSEEKTVAVPAAAAGKLTPPNWVGLRMEQDKLLLRWDPVPTAVAYNVYRSEKSGSGYEAVGNEQGTRHAAKEGLVQGKTYYYVITALNAEFEETAYSEERSIKYGASAEERAAAESDKQTVLEKVNLKELFSFTEAGPGHTMNQPADVYLNAKGDIYVTDALNAEVHCFGPDGAHRFSFGRKALPNEKEKLPDGTFLLPFSLAVDAQGDVYVTDVDRHDIQVFAADGTFRRRITVDTGQGKEPLHPNGIAVLDDGRMIVTDAANHQVLFLDAAGKVLHAVGSRGFEPSQFNFPDEVVVTPAGIVCVVDIINCRVQEFTKDGKFVRMFGSVGQSAGTFARPKGIAVDEKGRLWVADGMSGMIQCFTVEGEVKAAIGTKDDGLRFVSPRGMYFRGGKMFVVSRIPNRVSVYAIGG